MRIIWMGCVALAALAGCFPDSPAREEPPDMMVDPPPPPPPPPPAVFNPTVQAALDDEGCAANAMCHALGTIAATFSIHSMPDSPAEYELNYTRVVERTAGYELNAENTELIRYARSEADHPAAPASAATVNLLLAWMECGLPRDTVDPAAEGCVAPGGGGGAVYFRPTIQADLEANGCLGGACHGAGAGGYTAIEMPADEAAWMDNYDATVALTQGPAPDDSVLIQKVSVAHYGVTLDATTLDRWRAWVASGAPFEASGATSMR